MSLLRKTMLRHVFMLLMVVIMCPHAVVSDGLDVVEEGIDYLNSYPSYKYFLHPIFKYFGPKFERDHPDSKPILDPLSVFHPPLQLLPPNPFMTVLNVTSGVIQLVPWHVKSLKDLKRYWATLPFLMTARAVMENNDALSTFMRVGGNKAAELSNNPLVNTGSEWITWWTSLTPEVKYAQWVWAYIRLFDEATSIKLLDGWEDDDTREGKEITPSSTVTATASTTASKSTTSVPSTTEAASK